MDSLLGMRILRAVAFLSAILSNRKADTTP
jgi:hypothetical protein